jgi:diketogulonate reductase-like aldo/keto reductase
VALRWLVQQPHVVAIPRSSSPEYIAENAAVFGFELTEAELQTVANCSGGLSMKLRNKIPSLLRSLPL